MSCRAPCACRDCMDIATSSDDTTPALCPLCEDAGCEQWDPHDSKYPVGHYDCQSVDAYTLEEY